MTKTKITKQTISIGSGENGNFDLSFPSLQRHVTGFGSSGSGKTVAFKCIIEELAMKGVPVIAIDPQGDIASLALTASDSELEKNGVSLETKTRFNDSVEVVIWTPGSTKGLPLSVNPIQFDGLKNFNKEERTKYFFSASKNISYLAGYDSDTDECKSVEILLTILFEHCISSSTRLNNFTDLISVLKNIPKAILEKINSISTPKSISTLIKKLNLLTLGVQKLIFENGIPLNIDRLLGNDGTSDKTRISVIYLNSLGSFKEKDFFISELARSLQRWMINNPDNSSQDLIKCAFFIDEIAPYIPPVKVPCSKQNLEVLFRQGRKYGVVNLIASQSPGDIDYKAIGQFSTVILGALNTQQDIEKVKTRLKSVAPKELESIIQQLPSLNPGEFIGVSPDNYDQAQFFKVRWLVTQHKIIPENKIKSINPSQYNKAYIEGILNSKEDENNTLLNDKIKKPTHIADPDNHVLLTQNIILERDLQNKIRPYINGVIYKKEKLISTSFSYLPLIQVQIIFKKKKGLFKKQVSEISENLYLHFKSYEMLYVRNDRFAFSSVIDSDPNEILDLDNYCKLSSVNRKDVDFDFRVLGGKKLNKRKIKSIMERKYRIDVLDSCLVLFPYWTCDLESKRTGKIRHIHLDGIFGNKMIFSN